MSISADLARIGRRDERNAHTVRVNDAIRQMKARQVPTDVIARELGVSATRVSKIYVGR